MKRMCQTIVLCVIDHLNYHLFTSFVSVVGLGVLHRNLYYCNTPELYYDIAYTWMVKRGLYHMTNSKTIYAELNTYAFVVS